MTPLKVGFIGWRGHAARLIALVEGNPSCCVTAVYHPAKLSDHPGGTSDFARLLDCDAVMLSSPTPTHADYLETLSARGFAGHVLCEKPPVARRAELAALRALPAAFRARLYFNFNYRFSELGRVISSAPASLGKINHLQFIASHGLAYKPGYAQSWRGQGIPDKHSPASTVAVHFIDLLNYCFGAPRGWHYFPANLSGRGDSFDSCQLSLTYDDDVTASIYCSYAGPKLTQYLVIGANGYLVQDERGLTLRSPRDSFDDKGFFAPPPARALNQQGEGEAYGASLARSVDFFLTACRDRQTFPPALFQASLCTNEILLDIVEGRGQWETGPGQASSPTA